jgi:hypothetical protein
MFLRRSFERRRKNVFRSENFSGVTSSSSLASKSMSRTGRTNAFEKKVLETTNKELKLKRLYCSHTLNIKLS